MARRLPDFSSIIGTVTPRSARDIQFALFGLAARRFGAPTANRQVLMLGKSLQGVPAFARLALLAVRL